MKRVFGRLALLMVLSRLAVSQTSDCSTLRHERHKVFCLCGTVHTCVGDICLSPSVYGLDDEITVELRGKNGALLDTQQAAFEVHERHGTNQGGEAVTLKQNDRTFSFDQRQDGDYLLAFVLHQKGVAQPAEIFPVKYSHKRDALGSYYMVEPICTRPNHH